MAHHGNRSHRFKFSAVCCHSLDLSNASIRMLLRMLPFRSLTPAFHLRTKGACAVVSLKPVDLDFRLSPEVTLILASCSLSLNFVFLRVLCHLGPSARASS